MNLLILSLILVLFFFVPQISYEHQNGCHRWHSCPSDSGSYVCGDLGYDTYCPDKRVASYAPPPIDDNVVEPVLNPAKEKWPNIRGEMVSVFPSSIDILIERGYLVERQ